MIDQNFWSGKRVFLTGHTGFKGGWLSLWLNSLGATVKGYALKPSVVLPSLFNEARVGSVVDSQIGDIRDQHTLYDSMTLFNPDILIHMAAQPLVRYSYSAPIETYEVNTLGTVKVLEVARSCTNLKAIINITTDKCYENDGRSQAYKESSPMGGYDPYSSSKGCAELVTSAYRRSFFQDHGVGLASVRAGNVIGGGDWADDRLIPDIIKAFESGKILNIRSPNSIRPWQHVLEPLSGYLILAQKLYEDSKRFSMGWNFGPRDEDAKPVKWIVNEMHKIWGNNAQWNISEGDHLHEEKYLKLDYSKAKNSLFWEPKLDLKSALEMVVEWHKAYINKEDLQEVTIKQIEYYSTIEN